MAIKYQDLRDKRQWRATVGLSKKQFFKLSRLFGESYEAILGNSIEKRHAESSGKARFKTYRQLVFFCLYSLKSGLSYDNLGFLFDLSRSNAMKNQKLALRILQATLLKHDFLPKRSFESVEEFEDYITEEGPLLIDATEQTIQRPGNNEEQKKRYSGKKKTHDKKPGDKSS